MFHFVYVLQNSCTGVLYIGYTTDLKRRLKKHQEGRSSYTRKNKKEGTWKLIYFEAYTSRVDARSREKFLKGGSGRKYLKRQLRNYFSRKN